MQAVTLALVVVGLLTAVPAQALTRDAWDEQEFQTLRTVNPHLAELLEKGEALGVAGALEEADAVFKQGEAENHDVAFFWRRDCEVLTSLGRRKEAVEACERALQAVRTPANNRAYVRAQVDGPTPPTTAEMAQALRFVAFQRQVPSNLATPPAMVCDIAEAIGDGVMLQTCAEELLRIAPEDRETRRAVALLASRCPPARFWTGWLAILAAALVTAGHALRRSASRARRASGAATAVFLLCLLPSVAHAEESQPRERLGKWPIDEAHPETAIPTEEARNAEPFEFGYWLQDVTLMAKRASKRGDHKSAARLYRALSIAVPDAAVSSILACQEYELDFDLDNAIKTCGDALLRDGVSAGDYAHFIKLVLLTPGKLSDKQIAALGAVLDHMRNDPGGRDVVDEMECEVGARTSNVAQLRECTQGLAQRAPDHPKTLTYQWALAVQEGHYGEAEKLLDRAKAAGVAVDEMRQATAADRKRFWMRVLQAAAVVVFIAAGAAIGRRMFLRRRKAAGASTVAS